MEAVFDPLIAVLIVKYLVRTNPIFQMHFTKKSEKSIISFYFTLKIIHQFFPAIKITVWTDLIFKSYMLTYLIPLFIVQFKISQVTTAYFQKSSKW